MSVPIVLFSLIALTVISITVYFFIKVLSKQKEKEQN